MPVSVPGATLGDVAKTLRDTSAGKADAERPAARALPVQRSRLVLERVQQVTEAHTASCTVVLRAGEEHHTGIAEGAATPGGVRRALATATVRAVESASLGRLRLDVEAADVVPVAGQDTAVVLVTLLTPRGPEQLGGAVPVGADPAQALVKAVLGACNRRVAAVLT